MLRRMGITPAAARGSGFWGQAAPRPTLYLLRELCLTDGDLTNGQVRTCEPGPGTITIRDTAAKVSISGGKLFCNGGGAGWDTAGFWSTAQFARTAGRMFYHRYTHASGAGVTNGVMMGPTANANAGFAGFAALGVYVLSGHNLAARYGTDPVIATLTAATEYEFLHILAATGRFVLSRVAGSGAPWSLLWFDGTGKGGVSSAVYLGATTFNDVVSFDSLLVPDKLWTPPALVNATAVAGADHDAAADLVADLTITWGTGQTAGFSFRSVAGGGTGWHVYAHTDGKFKLDKVGGTGAGNKFAAASANFINGRTAVIRVVADATTIKLYLWDNTLATWVKQGSDIDTSASSTEYDARTVLNVDAGSTATLGNLTVYQRRPSPPVIW